MQSVTKRGLPLLLCLALTLALTACGGQTAQSPAQESDARDSAGGAITSGEDLDGKILAVFSNPLPEETFEDIINERLGIALGGVLVVPTPSEEALLVLNDQAQAALVLTCAAKYIVARNPELTYFPGMTPYDCSMVMSRESGLKDSIDGALAALREDGTLDELIDTWFSDEAVTQDPEPAELPSIEGAETIRVGINGTMPPLDYTTADGKPGGFNVALIGEVARLLGKNVELVPVETETKFMALSSGKIDLFFWHFFSGTIPDDVDASEPYLTDISAFLVRAPEG